MLLDRNNVEQFALFEKRILYPFVKDTVVNNTFGKFTSTSSSGIIWEIKTDQKKGAGETVTFGLYQNTDPIEVYDDESLSGKGQINRPVSDSIRLGERRFAVKTEGKHLAEIQTKIAIDSQLKEDLHTKSKLLQTRRIINQFAFCFDNKNVRNNANHKSHSYVVREGEETSEFNNYFHNKIKTSTIDADINSVSSDRVVIGNDIMGALQATVELSIVNAQIGNNDPNAADAGTMTTDHIEKLVRVANIGGRKANSEQLIVPYKTSKHFSYDNNNFVLFVAPSTTTMLRKNNKWINQIERAFRETDKQPSMFYNSCYIGSIYNVDIIEVPEFEHLIVKNTDGSRVAYSAMCGQSSIVSAMGMAPMFTVEDNDHKKIHELGVTMIDGMKPLKFLSKNPAHRANKIHVERGIVHSFTRLT